MIHIDGINDDILNLTDGDLIRKIESLSTKELQDIFNVFLRGGFQVTRFQLRQLKNLQSQVTIELKYRKLMKDLFSHIKEIKDEPKT